MAMKPHAETRLAKFVAQRISDLQGRKNQVEIAAEAGYVNANNLTMIKGGASKLALDRVPDLARALECGPAFLLRLAMEQALGETAAKAVGEIWGTPLTRNEVEWIAEIRDASGDTDPRLTTRSRTKLREIFGR
ncbi:XRE family transcriptional regulator [Pararhodobacter sp.]|uniref:XRE family transcriptional regulator n=1 Tax=Pararhodobacter sp. TaxID=2127056 RepID=UPI002FDCFDA6